jgi:cytoskeleton protein RodZ
MKENLRAGYGQRLAEVRAEKGMTVADVAAKLKLTVRQVEALEAEDTSQLPGDVFMRGFVRNYARLLELEPDELVVPMDAESAVAETITAHSEGVILKSGSLKRWVVVPLVILGVFVIFVAVLYQWLRQGEDTLITQSTQQSAPAELSQPLSLPPGAARNAAAPQAATMPSQAAAPGKPVAATAPAGQAEGAMSTPAGAHQTTAAGDAQTAKPVTRQEAAPPAATAGTHTHTLRFLATHDAWIQVVDGDGKRFSELVRAGGTNTITGAAPFKLVVGEAAEVRLTFDGHPIDLTPFIGQKVARLTLE